VPIAVIVLDFDPVLHFGDVTVRWQTVALAATIFVALCLAAVLARRSGLGADDLLLVVVGAVPGAVIGGRIGYVLAHLDYYQSHLDAVVDPGHGTLSLSLAVAGGTLSAALVARLLGTPIRRWLHVAALPVLFGIALGKLTMALAAAGQGMPAEVAWATSYVGPGPWSTLAPELPSHPAQVYEGIVTLGILAIMAIAFFGGALRQPNGRVFCTAVAAWAAGRVIVGLVWRDSAVLGPLGAEQLLTLTVGAAFLALAVLRVAPNAHSAGARTSRAPGVPEWPDPSSRPRF